MIADVTQVADSAWRSAIAATLPLLMIGLACRLTPMRPATRHTLWLVALLWIGVSPMLPRSPLNLPAPAEAGRAEKVIFSENDPAPDLVVVSEQPVPAAESAGVGDFQTTFPAGNHSHTPSLPPRDLTIHEGDLQAPTPPRTGARIVSRLPGTLARASRPIGCWSAFFPPPLQILAPYGSGAMEAARAVINAAPAEFRGDRVAETRGIRLAGVSSDPAPARGTAEGAASPAAATTITEPSHKPSGEAKLLGAWITGLARIRDAIGGLPAIPWSAWISGIILIGAARLITFRRQANLLRGSRPAPPTVLNMVERCARSVGLAVPPDVLMTDRRISPMVHCIGRPRLLLPAELWENLDRHGRESILLHELAHLRRRDHWVRWAESILSGLYWWHPGVWWARRRLREEAENCCDAWVTWLMPRGRRAYAQALLQTRAFMSCEPAASPTLGIAAISVRARPLARRLTMVMTQTTRPGLSLSGAALILALAASGWLVTPAFSCPDEEGNALVTAPTPAVPAAAPQPPPPPAIAVIGVPAPAPTPVAEGFGPALAGSLAALGVLPPRGPRPDDDDEIEQRIDRLERQIQELIARGHGSYGGMTPQPPMIPRTPAPPMVNIRRRAPIAVAGQGPKVWRPYKLSQGKLDALTELMSRQDVPVLVRRRGEILEIEATDNQHEIIGAFILMIEPQGGAVSLPRTRVGVDLGNVWQRELREKVRAEVGRGMAKGKADREQALKAMRRDLQRVERDARRQSQDKHRELQALERARERLEQQAERLREKADQLRQKADESRDDARSQINEQSEQVLAQAGQVTEEAARIAEQVAAVEHEAHSMEAHAEELAAQIESAVEDAVAAEGAEEDADDSDDAERAEEEAALQRNHDHEAVAVDEKKSSSEQDAVNSLRARLEAHPTDGSAWYQYAYEMHMARKNYEEAIKGFKKAAELDTNKVASIYNVACGYARLSNKDAAFEWLKKAQEAGWNDREHIRNDEDLAGLREDARFKALVAGGDEDPDEANDEDDGDDDE